MVTPPQRKGILPRALVESKGPYAAVLGLDDVVIASTDEGLVVASKAYASRIRELAGQLAPSMPASLVDRLEAMVQPQTEVAPGTPGSAEAVPAPAISRMVEKAA